MRLKIFNLFLTQIFILPEEEYGHWIRKPDGKKNERNEKVKIKLNMHWIIRLLQRMNK